jgi:hypothetical protein
VAAVRRFVVGERRSRVWKEHRGLWVPGNVAMTKFGSAHSGTRSAGSLDAEVVRRSRAGRAERQTSKAREHLL